MYIESVESIQRAARYANKRSPQNKQLRMQVFSQLDEKLVVKGEKRNNQINSSGDEGETQGKGLIKRLQMTITLYFYLIQRRAIDHDKEDVVNYMRSQVRICPEQSRKLFSGATMNGLLENLWQLVVNEGGTDVRHRFHLDPAVNQLDSTLKSEIIQRNWNLIRKELLKFGIQVDKESYQGILLSQPEPLHALLIKIFEFERDGKCQNLGQSLLQRVIESQVTSGIRHSMDGTQKPSSIFGKISESQALPKGSLKQLLMSEEIVYKKKRHILQIDEDPVLFGRRIMGNYSSTSELNSHTLYNTQSKNEPGQSRYSDIQAFIKTSNNNSSNQFRIKRNIKNPYRPPTIIFDDYDETEDWHNYLRPQYQQQEDQKNGIGPGGVPTSGFTTADNTAEDLDNEFDSPYLMNYCQIPLYQNHENILEAISESQSAYKEETPQQTIIIKQKTVKNQQQPMLPMKKNQASSTSLKSTKTPKSVMKSKESSIERNTSHQNITLLKSPINNEFKRQFQMIMSRNTSQLKLPKLNTVTSSSSKPNFTQAVSESINQKVFPPMSAANINILMSNNASKKIL